MIIVTGGRGVVGTPLINTLLKRGERVLAVSRSARESESSDLQWVQWTLDAPIRAEFADQISDLVDGENTLIHCAPIWLLPPLVPFFLSIGVTRVIAFSSTSVISKQRSQSRSEQELVGLLKYGESETTRGFSAAGVPVITLRPTLIYGYGRDQNVAMLARFINRFGFVVTVGKASGLRQPVHADDLVGAVVELLDSSAIQHSVTYEVTGGETLTYDAMLRRIFSALEKPARIVRLPQWLLAGALKVAGWITAGRYDAAMAGRVNDDLIYNSDAARADFGYAPRTFVPQEGRDV